MLFRRQRENKEMRTQLNNLLKTMKKQKIKTLLVLIALVLLSIVLIWAIWADRSPFWTGFGRRPIDLNEQPTKTLWDWMEILIVPAVLGIGLYILNQSARASEREIAEKNRAEDEAIAEDNRNQATLEAYFDRMTELILDEDILIFNESENDDRKKLVRTIGITRTITVLRILDAVRVKAVFEFIEDAGLKEIISFKGANLRGVNWAESFLFDTNLAGVRLRNANLQRIHLTGSNLQRAGMRYVNLQDARLKRTSLQRADLRHANLKGAVLRGADLQDTNFEHANLAGADLSGVQNFTDKQLMAAETLASAIMPDGTKYEVWIEKRP